MIRLFETNADRLALGVQGTYPEELLEVSKEKSGIVHAVDERSTRPWLRHYFLAQALRNSTSGDDVVARDANLVEIFKTTIPLSENSFNESSMSAWRMFLENSFRDVDAGWYTGIRKAMVRERFHAAIEQLELEVPLGNPQRQLQFHDHARTLRRFSRVPVKLFYALPGNERESMIKILRQSIHENPHSIDVILLAYAFHKAWNREAEILDIARTEHRADLEEWYYWVEGNLKEVGQIKRAAGDRQAVFHIYERAMLTVQDYREIADWFLRENEFKAAYHFYEKAKEFETSLDLLQNIGLKEFSELTNLRRSARGEKPLDFHTDSTRIATMFQEEIETLRGFTRIRAAESYKQVAAKARQQFDRETVEMKYAFGELSEEEYQRLIRQLSERKQ